jgi:hypothetical protein
MYIILEIFTCIGGTVVHLYGLWNSKGFKTTKQVRACLVISPVWAEAKRTPEYMSTVTWTYFKEPNWGIWVTSVCQIWFAFRPRGLMPVVGPKGRRVLQVRQALIICFHLSQVKVGNCLCNMLALWCSKEWLCKVYWKWKKDFESFQQQW